MGCSACSLYTLLTPDQPGDKTHNNRWRCLHRPSWLEAVRVLDWRWRWSNGVANSATETVEQPLLSLTYHSSPSTDKQEECLIIVSQKKNRHKHTNVALQWYVGHVTPRQASCPICIRLAKPCDRSHVTSSCKSSPPTPMTNPPSL